MARVIRVVVACVLAVGLTVAAGAGSAAAAASLSGAGISFALREPLFFVLTATAAWIWARQSGSARPLAWGRLPASAGVAVLVGLGPLAAAWLLLALTGAVAWPRDPQAIRPVAIIAAIATLAFLLLHGLAEQVLVRRVCQAEAERRAGRWVGVLLAAGAWTAIQAAQGYLGPLVLINTFLFGCLLGLAACSSGGVLAAGFAHGLWSWAEVQMRGAVDGLAVRPGWLAGDGPDTYGAPAWTICLLVALAVLVLRDRRRAAPAGPAA